MVRRNTYRFNARDKYLLLGPETRIMGIVNITPDSFSGDGLLQRKNFVQSSITKAIKMANVGADIIDIGGESTRPGASLISTEEEIRRILPVIESLAALNGKAMISVDTSKAAVAKQALKAGAHIINVVRANHLSDSLLTLVSKFEAGIVLMHMRGTPKTMQLKVNYKQLMPDIISELGKIVKRSLQSGINKASILVDPGIGFSKVSHDNFLIINRLDLLKKLGFPILIGPSRKSFIGNLLGLDTSKRLTGTIAAVTASILQGAHIVRVHDCYEIKQAARIADAVLLGGK